MVVSLPRFLGISELLLLNDIYPADQLPNFWLGTTTQVLQPPTEPNFEEHEINTDQPPT